MARLAAPSLSLVLLLAVGAPAAHAQSASAAPFHGGLPELKGKTFTEGALSISVNDYTATFSYVGFWIQVLNTGASEASLDWTGFTVVGADRNQPLLQVMNEQRSPFRVEILPGAHMVRYIGFGSVKYPAKLYYKGQLLAEFTK